jgi:hypothetical protein
MRHAPIVRPSLVAKGRVAQERSSVARNDRDELRIGDHGQAPKGRWTPEYEAASHRWVVLKDALDKCDLELEGWWSIQEYGNTCENRGNPARGYTDMQSVAVLGDLVQKNLKLVDKSSWQAWIKGESEAAEIVYINPVDGRQEIISRYFRTEDACEAALRADAQAEQGCRQCEGKSARQVSLTRLSQLG